MLPAAETDRDMSKVSCLCTHTHTHKENTACVAETGTEKVCWHVTRFEQRKIGVSLFMTY